MIEPVTSLALALHTNPGAYALLVGSGLSIAAGVPTGWEIALDLVRQVAAARGDDDGEDPADWYERTFSEPLGYTRLLDALTSTASERMRLLQRYFEPTADEAEEGQKRPTRAHRAIAELVRDGYVRVIVTTNFDRLVETAVREQGIEPVVVSSGDDVAGAPPPAQASCFVVKVHGDYLDARLRNTPAEVAALDPDIESLVRRVLDEYGLVVAGWSAAWDTGLRTLIGEPGAHRYGAYWTARGALEGAAAATAAARGAATIAIRDADTFFDELRGQVIALRDLSGATGLTSRIAVARAKRHLTRQEDDIVLSDLLAREAEAVRERVATLGVTATGKVEPADYRDRLVGLERACDVLLPLAATVGFWAEGRHVPFLVRAIDRLAEWPLDSGINLFLGVRRYPATLALYAAGYRGGGVGSPPRRCWPRPRHRGTRRDGDAAGPRARRRPDA